MIVGNSNLAVGCDENGRGVTLYDYRYGQEWVLAEDSVMFSAGQWSDCASYAPLIPISAQKSADGEIAVTYQGKLEGALFKIRMVYCVHEDYAEVTLPADTAEAIHSITFPGSFVPAPDSGKGTNSKNVQYLLPIMQGMRWDGGGDDFDWLLPEAGHRGFSMAMFGMLSQTEHAGGLLITAETADDTAWRIGKKDGKTWAVNIQTASLGHMRYDRQVRLYPAGPSITAVAKRYRRRVMERGRFVSWEEKLRARPELERLFGTVFGFIGYCQDDELDYPAQCEALKDLGFPRAHLFPLRFNTYSTDFQMGGFPPIRQDEESVRRIKALGYDAAPWSWIGEGLDDGSGALRHYYREGSDGLNRLNWEIDKNKWYQCCMSFMPDYQKEALTGVCADMTWDHFDVMTCACNGECYAPDHPGHLGRPLSKTEDREWIRRLLVTAQAGSRPVSSENFNDAYSMEYDIGSVLAWPQYGPWDFWPIPLTMLVYHDSMIHTWWEAHAYNDEHFGAHLGKYQYGGGRPRLMSAMDALYGNPPFVFPFGAQYAWTGKERETVLYKIRLDDPLTMYALGLAREVSRLHERIGKLEMIDFSFVTPDGFIQKTTFAGGVSVYANFGPQLKFLPGIGTLEKESWKVVWPQ